MLITGTLVITSWRWISICLSPLLSRGHGKWYSSAKERTCKPLKSQRTWSQSVGRISWYGWEQWECSFSQTREGLRGQKIAPIYCHKEYDRKAWCQIYGLCTLVIMWKFSECGTLTWNCNVFPHINGWNHWRVPNRKQTPGKSISSLTFAIHVTPFLPWGTSSTESCLV